MSDRDSIIGRISQEKHNEDRIRRSKSWLKRSHRERTTLIEKFVFLWISFNAAYGKEFSSNSFAECVLKKEEKDKSQRKPKKPSQISSFKEFLHDVVNNDKDKALQEIFSPEFGDSITTILKNPCISQSFWQFARFGDIESTCWKDEFQDENKKLTDAWKAKKLHKFLPGIFVRLYALRNQVIHGGTTHPSGAGKRQIVHGTAIMSFLVPKIIKIMESKVNDDPKSDLWGEVEYPSIDPDILTSLGIKDHEMPSLR